MMDEKDDDKKPEDTEEEDIFGDDDLEFDVPEDDPEEDDLDDLLGDDDDNFGDFSKAESENTLADLWRNNPLFKIGTVFAGVALLFIIIGTLTGGDDETGVSIVPAGSEITAAPGSTEATPAFVEAVQEANQAEVERAIREGDSALPVPIETPVGRLSLPNASADQDIDPLERWRQLQQERLERELAQQEALNAQGGGTQDIGGLGNAGGGGAGTGNVDEAIRAMADVMSQQMQSVLENRLQVQTAYLAVTSPDFLERQEIEKAQRAQELAEARAAAVEAGGVVRDAQGNVVAAPEGPEAEEVQNIIYPAGQIAYAQLITEANSDSPGPVLAQIVAGPLKGSRVLGSFEVQRDLLTLNFDTLVGKDGISRSVEAVALDPDTTLAGMATEVDHRYLQRVILPAAAAFVEGAADAISNSGITTVTVSGDTVTESEEDRSNDQEISAGVSELGQELGDILDELADEVQVLIRIESGTPMGILFLQPVTDGAAATE